MLVNVADRVEHPKMQAYTVFLKWLQALDHFNAILFHSVQHFLCFSMVLTLLKKDWESVAACWFSSVIDNKLPHKVVKGGPKVISDFTYPYRIVNKRFGFSTMKHG